MSRADSVRVTSEVFAYIDDVRIAFPREEYETAIQEYVKYKNITGDPV